MGEKKRSAPFAQGTRIKEKSLCGFSMLTFHKEVNTMGFKFLTISGEASKTTRHLRLYFWVLGEGREESKECRVVST